MTLGQLQSNGEDRQMNARLKYNMMKKIQYDEYCERGRLRMGATL
jgi:hypothetical protein